MTTGKVTNHRNGRVTISGLTHGDCRLIARALRAGAFEGGDRGGPVSEAIARLEALVRTPAMFPMLHSPVEFTVGDASATDLYVEVTP